jgi:YhcH/YjgK/YiaL family protein
MIISSLNDSLLYENFALAHKRLPEALAALKKLASENPKDGKYVIDGDNIFASVMTYDTLPENEKKFEIHERYMDIQYIIEGEEIIGDARLDALTSTDGDGTDIAFFSMPQDYNRIRFSKGELAVIFPREPHAPGVTYKKPCTVKKIVVKVLY